MIVILIFSFFLLLLGFAVFFNPKKYTQEFNSFSIIIPCRNEENNLTILLNSIDRVNYPKVKYEVILIDDASEDGTSEIIKQYCIRENNWHSILIREKNTEYKGKKYAIKLGVEKARFDNLIFTDADCRVPVNWLRSFNSYISENTGMIVGYSPENKVSDFRRFTQILTADFYCATINLGLPFSNNGRNLYINKKAYEKVGGVENIKYYTCGEDKLLLNLIKKTEYTIK
ncbi:MAG: glycosyltransferase, partial [Candidatus Cloacimonetes bacterium]|nr:glycosyltransferase [Candidatus Cloacimonadota bacterium]